jgi:hypothetical protein
MLITPVKAQSHAFPTPALSGPWHAPAFTGASARYQVAESSAVTAWGIAAQAGWVDFLKLLLAWNEG